jgi:hypothetical protein
MLIFAEDGKPENPEKNPRNKGEKSMEFKTKLLIGLFLRVARAH